MATEKFCLRWNDFESNISLAFRELRSDEEFFDVTIACETDQISAHKVILSACSPFFRDILRRNPHQHPLLYLKGIKLPDLQSVLNFMYHGEVSVAQEDLNTFLAVAEELKVKGLTQGKSTGTKPGTSSAPQPQGIKPKPQGMRDSIHSLPGKSTWAATSRPSQSLNIANPAEANDDIQEVVPVKSEPRDVPTPTHQVASLPTQHTYHPSPAQASHSHAVAAADDASYDYQAEVYDDYDQYEADQQVYGAHGDEEAAFDGNKGEELRKG